MIDARLSPGFHSQTILYHVRSTARSQHDAIIALKYAGDESIA